MFYQYNKFTEEHFLQIEQFLERYLHDLIEFRKRDIAELEQVDEKKIMQLFRDAELILGPVGAAKCLHLIAPMFFPIWDRNIAKAYGCSLGSKGYNSARYVEFMKKTRIIIKNLSSEKTVTLKRIDEYNYCKYTKKWL